MGERGENTARVRVGHEETRTFTKALLRDLRALETMLEEDLFESDVRRIGAEQEMFLVNEGWRPAPVAMELLKLLGDPYTTELALYNLEANLDPRLLQGSCFSELESELTAVVDRARSAAAELGVRGRPGWYPADAAAL